MAQAFNYADGLRWFGEGVRALRNRPLGLVGIVVFYVLISGLLSGLPVVGTILAGVWMPFGAVLTGFAAREALADSLIDGKGLAFLPRRNHDGIHRKPRRFQRALRRAAIERRHDFIRHDHGAPAQNAAFRHRTQ